MRFSHSTATVWLLLQTIVATYASSAQATCQGRYVVNFQHNDREIVVQSLTAGGYSVLSEGTGFVSVCHTQLTQQPTEQNTSNALSTLFRFLTGRRGLSEVATPTSSKQHISSLAGLPGVVTAEQDVRRHLHRPLPSGYSRLLQAASIQSNMSHVAVNEHLRQAWAAGVDVDPYGDWFGDGMFMFSTSKPPCLDASREVFSKYVPREIIPYGMKQSKAWNLLAPVPNTTIGKGMAICIIDSGIAGDHPEFKQQANQINGCSDTASKACAYTYNQDVVSHGTHVAGIIAAPQDGFGVVGVIPGGAELYIVRIWNTSGEVSQGQGPFATDLVHAYTACQKRLDQLDQDNPDAKYRMVLSMSFGSAGPLTVEKLWFNKAAQSRRMLFVASAGNNGSDPYQWSSYPASYDSVVSVANVNCDGGVEFSSQKNKYVKIAAPGSSILSSVPANKQSIRGFIYLSWDESEKGLTAANTPEPRAVKDTRVGSASSKLQPMMDCSGRQCANPKKFQEGICLSPLPGQQQGEVEACEAMTKCLKANGVGLVMWRNKSFANIGINPFFPMKDVGPSGGGDPGAGRANNMALPLDKLSINAGTKTPCWQNLDKQYKGKYFNTTTNKWEFPVSVVVSTEVGNMLLAKAGDEKSTVNVTTYGYPYRAYDGTSMSAPLVAGAAARIWADFPNCNASDVQDALYKTASQPSRQDVTANAQQTSSAYGSGILQVEDAYYALSKKPCARQTG